MGVNGDREWMLQLQAVEECTVATPTRATGTREYRQALPFYAAEVNNEFLVLIPQKVSGGQ